MKEEIKVGVEFLRQFLAKYGNNLHQAQIDLFALKLELTLAERYINHWYDKMPMKGQAFRCLRVKRSENYIDPVLEKLLFDLKLNLNQLGLPNDFTLWIDPGEVSVRFGDQVGYTYTIARLNVSPSSTINTNNDDNNVSINNINNNVLNNNTNAKPCLVVQNAEKILFDEKLTAFIRQNSCNNTNDEFIVNNSSTINDDLSNNNDFDDDNNKSNDFLINELIKLSAEKRTISPPHANMSSLSSSSTQFLTAPKSEIKRQNSSNIAIINNNKESETSKLTSTSSSSDKNNRQIINNSSNLSSNRLSFNDSCYYSSSSSSCASSFESNDEANLMIHQFGWFNNTNSSLKSPENNTNNLFGNDSITNSFYKDYTVDDQQQQQQQSSQQMVFSQASSLFSNRTSFIQPSSFGFSTFNANNPSISSSSSSSNNNSNNNNSQTFYNIYSDASSERSETPNSCITSSSYLMIPSPIMFAPKENNNNSNQTDYFDATSFMDTNNKTSTLLNVGSPVNSSSSSSTASNVSSKTTVQTNDFKQQEDQLDNIKMDLIVESSIDEAKSSMNNKINNSEKSSSPSRSSPNGKSKLEQENKKEESYCGYVESFPYYYKLNRLYNALAVQKMQADRLRKSGLFNNQQNNSNTNNNTTTTTTNNNNSNNSTTAGSLSTTPNNTPNQQQLSIGPNNNNTSNLFRNSPKSTLGTSPNQYIMNRINNNLTASSPTSSPSLITNNSILNSTSPPGANMPKFTNQRLNNNNLGINY